MTPAPTGNAEVYVGDDAGPATPSPYLVDALVDVAPAGPASAHSYGVVLIDKSNALHIARRGPLAKSTRPAPTPIRPLDLERAVLAPYGRGPALAGGHAYWVNQGRLLRRPLDGVSELEVLAPDARTGTRAAAASLSNGRTLVAYIAAPDASGIARAKLWFEPGKTLDLTPDGAGASSVALVAQKDAWLVISLDGRSGMSPLHTRKVLPQGQDLALGPDIVAWVGASAQPTTEIMAATVGNEVWGLVAIERDVTHFGLAQIRIGPEPKLDVPATFVPFENGVDTSAVASASLCGGTAVVFSRPSGPEPEAPHELVIAGLSAAGLAPGAVIARSRAFADASLAAVEGGALLAYTADYRTWAASLRCSGSKH